MQTTSIRPGATFHVVAPYEGPRGPALIVDVGVDPREYPEAWGQHTPGCTVLVQFPDESHYRLVRPRDVLRPIPTDSTQKGDT